MYIFTHFTAQNSILCSGENYMETPESSHLRFIYLFLVYFYKLSAYTYMCPPVMHCPQSPEKGLAFMELELKQLLAKTRGLGTGLRYSPRSAKFLNC